MELAVRPHIMSDRERRVIHESLPVGSTVQQVVDRLEFIDPRVREMNLAVFIDGYQLERQYWATTYINEDMTKVEVAAVLQGGGGGKKVLGMIAMLVLAYFTGGMTAGLEEAGWSAGEIMVAKAGIMMVGMLAINAIFAPPRVQNTKSGSKDSTAYGFSGQSNTLKPFGNIPRVYGRHRVVPDIAAQPYTINIGEEQYFTGVYCFGYGQLTLEDFKIGTNPLTNYKDYEIKVHENFTNSSQLELYTQDVWQDGYNLDLKQATGPIPGQHPHRLRRRHRGHHVPDWAGLH
jgi:predicted phage tail protein